MACAFTYWSVASPVVPMTFNLGIVNNANHVHLMVGTLNVLINTNYNVGRAANGRFRKREK